MDLQRAIARRNVVGDFLVLQERFNSAIGELALNHYSYYIGFWLVDRGRDLFKVSILQQTE